MSRIGILPISLPEGVVATVNGNTVLIKGPKGELSVELPDDITAEVTDSAILVKRQDETKKSRSLHGMARSLVANAVKGVTDGFEKHLEIKGVGFRAQVSGEKLVLTVGFSHLVEYPKPKGITFTVKGPKITVSGIDRQQVGEVAAQIRRIRPPDAYKGKGIRYAGEIVKLKPGKAAKSTGT